MGFFYVIHLNDSILFRAHEPFSISTKIFLLITNNVDIQSKIGGVISEKYIK